MTPAPLPAITNHVEEPTTLADRAYDALEELIVTLELPPGSFVSEARLSLRLGIGRTPIREALQRLRASHLVLVVPKRGVMISEVHVDEHLLALSVRHALERVIVVAATRNCPPEARDQFFALAAEMDAATADEDAHRFLAADRCFHDLETACARNPYATQAIAPLHSLSRRYWYMHHRRHGDLQRSSHLHTALIRAIAGGDSSGALTALDSLISFAEQVTLDALPGRAPSLPDLPPAGAI